MADSACKLLTITSKGEGRFVTRAHCNEITGRPFRPVQQWRLLNNELVITEPNAVQRKAVDPDDDDTKLQTRFVGSWCRVSGSLDVPDDQLKFERQRRGQACASDHQLVITRREMRGMFGSGVAGRPPASTIKAELMTCKVTLATENKNRMLWSWFVCNDKPEMRNVLLLSGGNLYLGNTMLEDKRSAAPHKIVLYEERGGQVVDHWERWKALAAQGGEVEIRGPCWSACTLIMAHIPRERLCFDKHAELNFHLAMRPNGEPSMEASRWMVDQYPEDIREWIKTMGGVERMPLPSPNHPAGTFYMLFPVQLWAMGYRKCAD